MITRRRSSNNNRRASKKRTSSKNYKYGVGETIDINEPIPKKSPQISKNNKKDKDVKISVIKKDDIEKYSHQIKIDLNENSENKMIIKNFNNSINKDKYRISPVINNKPIYRESPSLLQNYNNQINNSYKRQPNLVENNLLRNSPRYSPIQIKSNDKVYSEYVNNDLRRYSPTYIKDYSKPSQTYIKDSNNNFEYTKPKQSPKLIDYDIELGIKGRFKEYRESPSLLNNPRNKSPFIDYSKKENEIIKRNHSQSPRRYIDLTNNNFKVSPINNRNNEYRESPSFLRYNNILDNNKNMSNINKNTENKKHSPQLRNNKIENKNQKSPILQSQKNIPTLKQFQNTLKDSNNDIFALSEKSVPILTNLDNFILPKSHFKESLFLKNKEQITYFKNMPDITDKYICTIISDGIKINKQELDNKTQNS